MQNHEATRNAALPIRPPRARVAAPFIGGRFFESRPRVKPGSFKFPASPSPFALSFPAPLLSGQLRGALTRTPNREFTASCIDTPGRCSRGAYTAWGVSKIIRGAGKTQWVIGRDKSLRWELCVSFALNPRSLSSLLYLPRKLGASKLYVSIL